jgi:glycosyltransferase involved in cell wall biosynthesis
VILGRGGSAIAIAHVFRKPPYGGSNQFLLALRKELAGRGLDVGTRIGRKTRACLLHAAAFDVERVRRGLRSADARVVHRVDGPLARYRGFDDGTDARVAAINEELADVTIFQSKYSLDAHRELGLELRSPVVVPNAVDPEIFHPAATARPAGRPLRLIATSWSDNPNKGGATLEWLDEHLDWSNYELTFVGRTASRFRRITTIAAVDSRRLADLLRQHDAYVAPSRNDPCSNALLEALACGLPAVYLASGGHAELAGAGGLPFERDDELPKVLEQLRDEHASLRERIKVPRLEDVATAYLEAMGL